MQIYYATLHYTTLVTPNYITLHQLHGNCYNNYYYHNNNNNNYYYYDYNYTTLH